MICKFPNEAPLLHCHLSQDLLDDPNPSSPAQSTAYDMYMRE